MAAEDIGTIYNTKIPSLADAADIQEALRLYHYGSLEYDIDNADPANIQTPSLVGHLDDLQDQIDTLDEKRTAGDYLAAEPTGIADGYLWVDSSTSASSNPVYSHVYYSATAPTTDLITGIVWIDSSDTLKTAYVWDDVASDWIRFQDYNTLVVESKGDIIVGSGSAEYDTLAVGTDGYVLTADSSQPLGVKWDAVPERSFEIELIMGVY